MKWRQMTKKTMKSVNLFLLLLVCTPIFASQVNPLDALQVDIKQALACDCPERYREHRRLVQKFANSSIRGNGDPGISANVPSSASWNTDTLLVPT